LSARNLPDPPLPALPSNVVLPVIRQNINQHLDTSEQQSKQRFQMNELLLSQMQITVQHLTSQLHSITSGSESTYRQTNETIVLKCNLHIILTDQMPYQTVTEKYTGWHKIYLFLFCTMNLIRIKCLLLFIKVFQCTITRVVDNLLHCLFPCSSRWHLLHNISVLH